MFRFNSWNRAPARRKSGLLGLLAGGGMRRAVVMGAGMMAYRWWQNRKTAGRPGGGAPAWNPGVDASGRPVTQW